MEISHLRYPGTQEPQKSGVSRRHRKWPLVIFLLLIISNGIYINAALREPLPAVQATGLQTYESRPLSVNISWPKTGQASIGSLEQGVLASSENQKPMPIASTAKVVTALAVLKKKPIADGSTGETITLNAHDVELYNYYLSMNGSNVAVAEGERLSQYQAIEALMLPSANNMADTLAIWAFGTIENYTAYANTMLKEMDLTQTIISDASGFSPLTVSTPDELVIIGQQALKSPIIKRVVAEKQAVIPVAGTIKNTNQLLGANNVIGIKTGNTSEAGGCLLFAATHEIDTDHEITMIGAVTGAEDLQTAYQTTAGLLGDAAKGFGTINLIPAGYEVAEYKTAWGSESALINKIALNVYGWKGRSYKAEIKIDGGKTPLAAGVIAGTSNISVGGSKSSSNVEVKSALANPSTIWRLKHYFSL